MGYVKNPKNFYTLFINGKKVLEEYLNETQIWSESLVYSPTKNIKDKNIQSIEFLILDSILSNNIISKLDYFENEIVLEYYKTRKIKLHQTKELYDSFFSENPKEDIKSFEQFHLFFNKIKTYEYKKQIVFWKFTIMEDSEIDTLLNIIGNNIGE